MFGLEEEKGGDKTIRGEFLFDIEKEFLENGQKFFDLKAHLESQIQKIKQELRQGSDDSAFQELGMILQSYTSCLRVLERVRRKGSK